MSHDGLVRYDYQSDDPFVENDPPPGPAWMRNLIGLDYFATVVEVEIHVNVADDETASTLGDLPHLRSLSLSGTGITDSVMSRLQSLTQLQELEVAYSSVTDAGWEPLKHFPHLTKLRLSGDNITDSTLFHIKDLTDLTYLGLFYPQITDSGLQHLQRLAHLERLEIDRARAVTAAGVEELSRVLPKLIIQNAMSKP